MEALCITDDTVFQYYVFYYKGQKWKDEVGPFYSSLNIFKLFHGFQLYYQFISEEMFQILIIFSKASRLAKDF